MKHIFLVNPAAGKGKTLPALLQRITYSCEKLGVDYEIYHTTTVGDATRYAKRDAKNRRMKRFVSMLAAATER